MFPDQCASSTGRCNTSTKTFCWSFKPQRLAGDLVAWIIQKDVLSLVFSTLGVVQMPHKFTAARRHKVDKVQYRVINWAEY